MLRLRILLILSQQYYFSGYRLHEFNTKLILHQQDIAQVWVTWLGPPPR